MLAPGEGILSSVPGGGYESWEGTSMAAPHVAGAFAVLRAKKPNATLDELQDELLSRGLPVLDPRNNVRKNRLRLEKSSYLLTDIWQGDQGWRQRIPLDRNELPNGSGALKWTRISLSLPGSGNLEAQSDLIIKSGTVLLQGFWRGGNGYTREVPIGNDGAVKWDAAGAWQGPISLALQPGAGSMQAQSLVLLGNGTR